MSQQLGSFEKVLRVGEGRRLKRIAEQAAYVGTFEEAYEKLSDAELAAKTVDFRQRLGNGEHLDEIPAEYAGSAEKAREKLTDLVAEADETLMEKYLEGETLNQEELEALLDKAIAENNAV